MLKIIFDPLQIKEPKNIFNLDSIRTQFEFRRYYEEKCDAGESFLIYITSNEKYDYVQKYLPDVLARAEIEEYFPSKILSNEYNLRLQPLIDEIVSSKVELQKIKDFLRRERIFDKTFTERKLLDILLQALFNIPQYELSLRDEYKALFLLPLLSSKVKLRDRLRYRIKTLSIDLLSKEDLSRFRNYFWVQIFIDSASSKKILPRTILGTLPENFLKIDLRTIKRIFNDIIKDLDFARDEVRRVLLTKRQKDTLLDLIDAEKDSLYIEALLVKINHLKKRIKNGEEITKEQIENINNHLFASELKREIEDLQIYSEVYYVLDRIERKKREQTFTLDFLKEVYCKEIAPLILRIDILSKDGIALPDNIGKRYIDLIQSLDQNLSEVLLKHYEEIKQNLKGLTILSFPTLLRKYFDRFGKMVVIFIDALSLDLWLYLRDKLSKLNFSFGEEKYLFSLIPSETRFNKKSLFLGYPVEGFDPDENELASSFGIDKDKVFFERLADRLPKGRLKDIVTSLDWKILILSYNIIDERIKDSLAPGDLLRALNELCDKISPILEYCLDKEVPILIATDHGIRELNRKTIVRMKAKEISSFRWVEQSEILEPPEGDNTVKLERKFIAIGDSLLKKTPITYAHGGISLRECIIPMSVLTTPEKPLVKPKIRLITLQFIESELAEITFVLYNPNKVSVTVDKFMLELVDLPVSNIWIPPKTDIELRESIEIKFPVNISKIEEFSKDEKIEKITKRLKTIISFSFPNGQKEEISQIFELEITKNTKETVRASDKEIEELL